MRWATMATAGLCAVLGVAYLVEAFRYGLGVAAQPGPGLYPRLVGGLLLLASAGTALESRFRLSKERIEWPVGSGRWRVLAIVAATLGYVALLPFLGHPLTATLLIVVVLEVMGLPRWYLKVGLALAVGLGSQYAFAGLLRVPLPIGTLFGY